MATDYDAPRKTDEEMSEDLEELQGRVQDRHGGVDEDETDVAESLELPGADLSNATLTVQVVPKRGRVHLFLMLPVHHRSQLASEKNGVYICTGAPADVIQPLLTGRLCPTTGVVYRVDLWLLILPSGQSLAGSPRRSGRPRAQWTETR